jgi:hypothetical protein
MAPTPAVGSASPFQSADAGFQQARGASPAAWQGSPVIPNSYVLTKGYDIVEANLRALVELTGRL